MPKYYCDYCDVYLTHDAPRVRRDHSKGWKHAEQIRAEDKIALDLAKLQFMIDRVNRPGDRGYPFPPARENAQPILPPPPRYPRAPTFSVAAAGALSPDTLLPPGIIIPPLGGGRIY
ncbi:zf-U1-domain-containing protein [Rozella allomycis CSF55]|uniref:Zf-U1-domain-containing protein n=1 Tax=Rozella allomycis (strain CSF55) TaxID=988480 RepID=A0A075AMU9_ROZAC|nr:hypothetical protein O9G_001513 [Rozella allomycis CSF55]RKP20426.1 zf-U1-domain-containing protein [Rozella allomycis CSF55]|eukprot:EPZ31039.1 hypothetical protein O9G_001513 [Rozella allomycis CSF55]